MTKTPMIYYSLLMMYRKVDTDQVVSSLITMPPAERLLDFQEKLYSMELVNLKLVFFAASDRIINGHEL